MVTVQGTVASANQEAENLFAIRLPEMIYYMQVNAHVTFQWYSTFPIYG
jgi:hypothetical protein